jgi:crotonobetainyl-CoA:carnitine CoA-transferase CaiB-like acyl-CoA transferase
MTDPVPHGPLAGLRILDLSRILAGPTCTQLLGDLGAEVLKVERPGAGDDTRGWGPPYVADAAGEPTDLSAYFLAANRNKRSIAVDLATEAGVSLIRDLLRVCDVVVENYKPGDLERRGLGYDDLKGLAPRLVWCSITGFGREGPLSDRIGYDFLVQAMGGLMSITGEPDGEPMKVGVGIADVVCGLYATTGILAALRHRDATGQGQRVETSLYDTQIAWLINAATNHLVSGREPRRLGNRHPNIAPYQTYAARDGSLVVAVGNDRQFRRFAAVIGRPELGDDPRFVTNEARVGHVDALEEEISPALAREDVAHWVDAFTRVEVPAGPVATVAEALTHPHTLARGMVIEMPSPEGDPPLRLLGNPLRFERSPVTYRHAPPHLDADRGHILRDVLDLSSDRVSSLAAGGAFGRPAQEKGR